MTFVAAPQAQAAVPAVQDNTGVTSDVLPTAQINGVVWDQTIVNGIVYAGGEFTSARPAGAALGTSESPRYNLMSYNLSTGVMTDWAPVVNGDVHAITASPDGSLRLTWVRFGSARRAGSTRSGPAPSSPRT